MMGGSGLRRVGGFAGLLLALGCTAGSAQPLTPQEEAGKRVYAEGVSPGGKPLRALIGVQNMQVDGATLPCINCHGADGLGRPEGSVKPSDIRWSELALASGHRHETGRSHGPFTERSFGDSLETGKDPAGNRLDVAMPRYIMSHEDVAALIAYLKRIETDFDPGLSADRLRLGTLLPASGRLAELGKAMEAVLREHVARLNDKGGLFGRRIELVTAPYSDDRAATLRSAERLFRDENVFAVVSPFTGDLEREIGALAEQLRVPVVGPFTLRTQSAEAINRHTFFVLPGLLEQMQVLAEFAAKRLNLTDPITAVVHPDDPEMRELATATVAALARRGWKRAGTVHYPSGRMPSKDLVAGLQQRGVQVVLFLGTETELQRLGGEIRDAIWTPYLLAPGIRVGRAAAALPNTLGNRVFLVYPTEPADITGAGAAALAAFQRDTGIGSRHQPAQASAYASVLLLEEGLKRAGRDLSRAKLIGALENIFSFQTTVTPPLSFGPNRRVGALGGHVVSVDTATGRIRPAGGYIRVD